MTATKTIAAAARNAKKIYKTGDTSVAALDDVTVDFAAGEFTAIMGPSGSGKSTLMHCLAGLDRLTSGTVLVGNTDLSSLSDKELTLLRRTQVGFVFQSFNLIPTLSAKENILLPQKLGKAKVDQAYFEEVISTVGLADRLNHRPSELSGGQQQRVAVARSLISKPDVIFADEPTGNLDSNSGTEILEFMQRAASEFDQTVVMVTHDPVAASYANRAIFLSDGKITQDMSSPTRNSILDYFQESAAL